MNPHTINPAFPNLPPRDNPFQVIGFSILTAFVFVLYSRLFDVFLTSFQIPIITSVLVLAATVFSGGFAYALQHRSGKYLIAFTAWMFVTFPFSFWRGGSIPVMKSWIKAAIVYLFIVGLVATYKQCEVLMKAIGCAIFAVTLTALLTGTSENGRLFLSGGKFENPNDLAQILVIGLPFLFFIYKQSSQNVLYRFPVVIAIVLLLYVLMKTASRGSLLGLLILLIYWFFTTSMAGRLALALAFVVLVAVSVTIMPSGLRARFAGIFSSDVADQGDADARQLSESAATSSESRQRILKTSIWMTLTHPIVGVGPGMFTDFMEDEARTEGRRTQSLVSHNSYTQVSSETGFPGFFLYLGIITTSFRALKSVLKLSRQRRTKEWMTISDAAFCMRLALLAYVVTAFFSSVAYQALLPTLAGLCAVLHVTTMKKAASEQLSYARSDPAEASFPVIALPRLPARLSAGLAVSQKRS
jgi:O-antigen ligase